MSAAYELFVWDYMERTPGSRAMYEDAQRVLAGGANGGAGSLRPYPLYAREAHGAYLVDVDGNEYLDTFVAGGSNLLGHSSPVVVGAAMEQAQRGTNLVAPSVAAVELAHAIQSHMPHLELLRFTVTGSEAVMMCQRIARAFTGREKSGKFEGHYHGAYDNVAMNGGDFAGPEDDPVTTPVGAGIPAGVIANTVALPFNNVDAMVAVIERHADQLASVVLEPLCGAWLGGVAAEPEFVHALREVTAKHGILLIFDEVLTGFRLGLGGAAELLGVTPDLTALAKAIAAGFPLGAYGGRKDIMDATVTPPSDPADTRPRIVQSGTFQSNSVSLAAGLAAIAVFEKPGVYERLHELGSMVREGISKLAASLAIPVTVLGYGPICAVYFTDGPVRNVREATATDWDAIRTFHMGLLAHGVYSNQGPRQFNNLAQTDADIERLLEAAGRVLKVMKAYQ